MGRFFCTLSSAPCPILSRSAYCSDDCQGIDATSPSISSSSSALSSPHLGYANGADVPPLLPSALSHALFSFRRRDQTVSSGWSGDDDDDDVDHQGASLVVRAEHADTSEPNSDKQQLGYIKSSALHYTRRPSGTNNQSTVPTVHRRMSSTSSSSGPGTSQSTPHPSHSSTEDDDALSDFGLPCRSNADTEDSDVTSEKGSDRGSAGRTKRSRNRVSLPACFSLLQMSSPGNEPRSSPVSSSSGKTVARPSPPTPKLAVSSRQLAVHATPRGRRRVPRESSTSQRSDSSHSRERDAQDRSCVPTRGRATVRRSTSPAQMESRRAGIFDRSVSGGGRRGRARNDELDGIGFSEKAPGFGNGRSGLVGRERDREHERCLGFVERVPL